MCVSRCLTCFLGDTEGPLPGAHGSAAACAEAGNPLNPNKQATRREGKKEDKAGVKTRVHEPENDLMEEHPEGSQKGPAGSWKQPRAIREQVWDSMAPAWTWSPRGRPEAKLASLVACTGDADAWRGCGLPGDRPRAALRRLRDGHRLKLGLLWPTAASRTAGGRWPQDAEGRGAAAGWPGQARKRVAQLEATET